MTWEDAPALLEQLRTQLLACAAWTGGPDNVHYPKAQDLAAEEFPLAVLADTGRNPVAYAVGAAPIHGGTLLVLVYASDSSGYVEQLGRDLADQLLAQQTGILFTSAEVGLSSEPSPAKIAAGSDIRSIAITLSWGLSP